MNKVITAVLYGKSFMNGNIRNSPIAKFDILEKYGLSDYFDRFFLILNSLLVPEKGDMQTVAVTPAVLNAMFQCFGNGE